jgi:hypothetical protein
MACPSQSSGKNSKKRSANKNSEPEVSLLCSSAGTLLDQQQAVVPLSQLSCAANPADTERPSGQPCGPNQEGQLVDIGFQVGENRFLPLIAVCHVAETETTLYSRHTIHGNLTRDRIREAGRPAFREGGLFYRQVRAAQAYSKQSQLQMFTKLFGPQQAAEYFSNNYFLAKGHLAPDADFYFKGKMY